MGKAIITATSDFSELISDILEVAEGMSDIVQEAANAQSEVLLAAMKTNWSTMVPWASAGDYVYDSMGYNTELGANGDDVVGSVGVFKLDSVMVKHGKDKPKVDKKGKQKARITAPQLMYWNEYGYTDYNGVYRPGIPVQSNAFHATKSEQDRVFADELIKAIGRKL